MQKCSMTYKNKTANVYYHGRFLMHLKQLAGHHCCSGLGLVVYLRVGYLGMHVGCPGLCSVWDGTLLSITAFTCSRLEWQTLPQDSEVQKGRVFVECFAPGFTQLMSSCWPSGITTQSKRPTSEHFLVAVRNISFQCSS